MEKTLLFSLFLWILVASGSSIDVPAIFIFGDSIFDAGNNHFNKNCTIQADFPPYGQSFFRHPTGRFTNGRTVADFVCEMIGIDLQKPYLEAEMQVRNRSRKDYPANGMNFASAGSGVMKETNADSGVTPIQTQLQQFEALVNQNKIDKKIIERSFFFFESGSNDIFQYFIPFYTPKLDADAFVSTMITEVEHMIRCIYELGARRIAVFGLGPVGCVPARTLLGAPMDVCHEAMNQMVMKFNLGLESLIKDVPTKLPGAVGVYGATFDIIQRFRASPKDYGFSNTTNACCGEGTLGGMVQCGTGEYKVCGNPNEFLFWDYFHPTEHAYKLITKAFWGGKQQRIRPLNLRTLANITV
ncbi:GDSL esterase/lipase 6 [Magnolia sinica]|uniref:GDSL esterase/lipase 6 n=1 Tax=Magnolia sinica TaxID=86752 RepID=UPI002658F223|nr:GDSL esterase/lipase 6 [Magnolia sinica]